MVLLGDKQLMPSRAMLPGAVAVISITLMGCSHSSGPTDIWISTSQSPPTATSSNSTLPPAPKTSSKDLCRATEFNGSWSTSCMGHLSRASSYSARGGCQGSGLISVKVLLDGKLETAFDVPCGKITRNSVIAVGKSGKATLQVDQSGSIENGWIVIAPD